MRNDKLSENQFHNLIHQATLREIHDPTIAQAMRKAKISTWGSRNSKRALRDLEKLGDTITKHHPDSHAARAWRRRSGEKTVHETAKEHFRIYQNVRERLQRIHASERGAELVAEREMEQNPKKKFTGPRTSVSSLDSVSTTANPQDTQARTSALGNAEGVISTRYSVSQKPDTVQPTTMSEEDFDALRQDAANLPDVDVG